VARRARSDPCGGEYPRVRVGRVTHRGSAVAKDRRPSSVFSLTIVRPCFFFSAPDIAPRTLCACQSRDLLICSMVAPSGRRSSVSSRASLVLGLAAGACLRAVAPALAISAVTLFFLLIMGSSALHLAGIVAGTHALLPVANSSSRTADHAIANIALAEPFHGWPEGSATMGSNPGCSASETANFFSEGQCVASDAHFTGRSSVKQPPSGSKFGVYLGQFGPFWRAFSGP